MRLDGHQISDFFNDLFVIRGAHVIEQLCVIASSSAQYTVIDLESAILMYAKQEHGDQSMTATLSPYITHQRMNEHPINGPTGWKL